MNEALADVCVCTVHAFVLVASYVLRLDGDPVDVKPPPERAAGRNSGWKHLYAADVLSMVGIILVLFGLSGCHLHAS